MVGSLNPVKINAVRLAAHGLGNVDVQGVEVVSGVGHQPQTREETRQGAQQRAKSALQSNPAASLGVGLEGGVDPQPDGLYNIVWCVVVDRSGKTYEVAGAHFLLPSLLAKRIQGGAEMGPLLDELLQEQQVKQKLGMVGTVTKGYVSRTEEYASLAKLAMGLWFGRDWQQQLP